MKEQGYNDWTMVHACYADAGGFWLQARESKIFPLTARQLGMLVARDYVAMPKISRQEIWDKSKSDRFAKCIAFLQIVWLVSQVLSRAAQKLPVTPLELMTVAIIICTVGMFCFWFDKPLDVEVPTILTTDLSIAEILVREGDCAKVPFRETPLDFAEPEVYITSKWNAPLLRFILRRGMQHRPLKRIPNDRDPQMLSRRQRQIFAIITFLSLTSHLAGWNFDFKDATERFLWRLNSLAMIFTLGLYGIAEAVTGILSPESTTWLNTGGRYKRAWPACLWFVVPTALYYLARLLLIFEAFFSLRSLPSGAYATVRWSHFLPHI